MSSWLQSGKMCSFYRGYELQIRIVVLSGHLKFTPNTLREQEDDVKSEGIVIRMGLNTV